MDPNQPMPPSSPMQSATPRPMSSSAPVAGPPRSASAMVNTSPSPAPSTQGAAPVRIQQPVQNSAPQQSTPPTSVQNPATQVAAEGESSQQHHPNNANDLYAQITAEDEEIIVVPKKKAAPLISVMAVFMKITFWMDEFRHSHERFFIFLHTVWACIMGVLYLAGSITLFLSVFSFMQLPVYLEKYFSERGIQYDSLEMADYSFSEVEVINLRDANNSYNIPKITIRSTFADFLQNRIRMVEASDLNIDVAVDSQAKMADFDLIVKLLQAFSEPKNTGLELDVNTIRINNAILNIKVKDHTIPVSFTLSGDYTGENVLVVTFSINESFLKMSAKVTITGSESDRKVEIKINDNTGFLTLPQRPTEQLEGSATIQMQNHKVQTVEMESKLNYAYTLKTIRLNLQANDQENFDGDLLFTMGDSSDSNSASNLSTDITFTFKDLNFTPDRQMTTDQPLQVNLRRLMHKDTIIEGLNTTLLGHLNCLIDQASCGYSLKQDTRLQINNLEFDVKGQTVRFSHPAFTVKPTQKENIKIQLTSPYLQIEAPIEKIQLTGNVGEKSEKLQLNADTVNLQMTLAQKPTDTHLKISTQDANYITPNLSMEHINMSMDDYFDETSKIQFSANSIQMASPLLQKPISLEITNVSKQTALQAKVIDTDLTFNAQGYFDPFKSAFVGRFAIPLIDLNNLPFALSDLSSAFSDKISNLKGLFTASGQLKVNGISNISGPLYIGFQDFSFNWDDTTFSGINGVIGLQSLVPLVTLLDQKSRSINQKLFVQNIQTFIPISNLLVQFYINNQSLRLANMSAQIAGQDVMMSSSLIPMKNTNVVLPLRTAHNFDLSQLNPYFDLSGISLKEGKGLFNLPIGISENGIEWDDLTIKMTDCIWQKDTDQSNQINLFAPDDTAYNVRSGQLILNQQQQLQIAVDGWHIPSKNKDSFGPETIKLSEPLLKKSPDKEIPVDIQKLQKKFGM